MRTPLLIAVSLLFLVGCGDSTGGPGGFDASPPFDASRPDAARPPDTGAPDAGRPDSGPDCAGALDGTSCGALSICLGGACVQSSCGDGFVDTGAGEECEDGNIIASDGCEPTCRFTCSADTDCDDDDLCTGVEVCLAGNLCSNPPGEDCDDTNPCTSNSCDALLGCTNEIIDNDGDGFASIALGACGAGTAGGDCDDSDPTTYPGAFDGCDGAGVNNDCDSLVDEDGTGTWYADCDGDGFSATTAGAVDVCDMPSSAPAGCAGSGGSWTILRPTGTSNTDCDDGRGGVFPGAVELVGDNRDENCDGRELCYRDRDGDNHRTDEVITSTADADCNDAGEARASDPLEWATSSARDICCDQDANMRQNQTGWRSFSDDPTGNEACPSGRRWDYDCDGRQERRYTTALNTCFWEPAGCSRGGDSDSAGWFTSGSAPGCGTPPTLWVDNCHQDGLTSCSLDFGTREQDCR